MTYVTMAPIEQRRFVVSPAGRPYVLSNEPLTEKPSETQGEKVRTVAEYLSSLKAECRDFLFVGVNAIRQRDELARRRLEELYVPILERGCIPDINDLQFNTLMRQLGINDREELVNRLVAFIHNAGCHIDEDNPAGPLCWEK